MKPGTESFFSPFSRRRVLRKRIAEQRDRLYRIAWAWCHDSVLADDLVQETQTRALAKLDSLREVAQLEVWLTKIMVNLHRDLYRRTQPETGHVVEPVDEKNTPEAHAEQAELIDRTRRAVAELQEDQRQVLTLVDLAEFSYADTARILALPQGTVMSRLSRARSRLRAILDEQLRTTDGVVPFRRSR